MRINGTSATDIKLVSRVRNDSNPLQHIKRRVCNDMTLLDYVVTAGNEDKPGWKVRDNSNLRYGNAVMFIMTYNSCGLDRQRWRHTIQSWRVRNDDKLNALHRASQSDRVNYWLDNLAHGQPSTILDIIALRHAHNILPEGYRFADTVLTLPASIKLCQALYAYRSLQLGPERW